MAGKRTIGYWFKSLLSLPEAGALLVAIVVILALLAMGVRIPLWLAIVAAIGIVVKVYFIHIIVIPALRKSVTGREGMIGLQGRAVQPLTPVGTIHVKGESWKAESVGDYVEVGENVEVVGIEGLTLRVVRLQED